MSWTKGHIHHENICMTFCTYSWSTLCTYHVFCSRVWFAIQKPFVPMADVCGVECVLETRWVGVVSAMTDCLELLWAFLITKVWWLLVVIGRWLGAVVGLCGCENLIVAGESVVMSLCAIPLLRLLWRGLVLTKAPQGLVCVCQGVFSLCGTRQ